MGAFSFHPELIELQSELRVLLANSGLELFSDYSAVDCLHDVCGLEVTGCRSDDVARAALKILKKRFPKWTHSRLGYKDFGADLGWKAVIHRDEEDRGDAWETTEVE